MTVEMFLSEWTRQLLLARPFGLALVALLSTADARLAAQATVVGSVRDAAGRPIGGAVVTVADGPPVLVDSLGRYRLDNVPLGHVTITARRVGFNRETARIQVTRIGTRHDFTLRPILVQDSADVWLGCTAAPPTVLCARGRHVANRLTGFRESGAWIFRDSATFHAFWRARRSSEGPEQSPPSVDWRHEGVVAVSYGGYSGCGPATYVNRIERRLDSMIVLIGPDKAGGGFRVTCTAYLETADLVVIPLAKGPVVFRVANDQWGAPPVFSSSPLDR